MTQPLAAGDSVGRYTVIRPLGQGGMGLVFEVKHQTLGTRAALKLLWTGQAINRELAARFLTEARAGGAIEHPGVVRVLEYDVLQSGVPYLLMEFLPGETLSQRLQRGRHLGLAALPILQQIADTLAAVHARGIVHRDISIIYSVSLRKPQKTIQRRRRDDVDANSEWKSHILDAASH